MKCGMEDGNELQTRKPTDRLLRTGLRGLRRPYRDTHKRYRPAGKTAALWTKLNGVPITPEMIHCTGCRAEGAKTPFCDKLCPVHHCVREKSLDTCADCRQMDSCPTLGRIAANSPFVLDNLRRLREGK